MALADGNEPLRLRDGRLVYPGGSVADPHSQPVVEAPRVVAQTRRGLNDLPLQPRQMNAIGAVLMYELYGLDDEEIGAAVGLTPEQVTRLKTNDAYMHMHDAVVRTVLDSETDVVRELIAKNARRAAATMVDGLDAANRQDRMAAARDILDRSGHRPADVVEHRHRMDGGLVIEIVRRDDDDRLPTIDMGGV